MRQTLLKGVKFAVVMFVVIELAALVEWASNEGRI